jgi:hypothetical protein
MLAWTLALTPGPPTPARMLALTPGSRYCVKFG